jgi:hypothetical protein
MLSYYPHSIHSHPVLFFLFSSFPSSPSSLPHSSPPAFSPSFPSSKSLLQVTLLICGYSQFPKIPPKVIGKGPLIQSSFFIRTSTTLSITTTGFSSMLLGARSRPLTLLVYPSPFPFSPQTYKKRVGSLAN